MRTTIRLPEDLMSSAKEKARREGSTLTAIIEEGVRLVIAGTGKPAKKFRLPRVSKARGGLRPGINPIKTSKLLELDDKFGRR
ncbi:MAG: ribbon-helix-helix protein, CopG family [Aestuariivirga sp.]